MKTTDASYLRKFYTVLNRNELTQEIYDYLLDAWNLKGKDLDKEMELINQKKSGLSKSRRDAVPEFLILRRILEEKKAQNTAVQTMNQNSDISNDQIILN